jgi:membrane protein
VTFVRALFRRLGEIDFVDEATPFGAGLLISVVPFLILLSAFASERIDDDIELHLGLDHQAANIVTHLFNNASPAINLATVTSALIVIAGSIAVVTSLQEIYEKVFGVEHRGRRDLPRVLIWTVLMIGAVAAAGTVDRGLLDLPGGAVLVEVLMFVLVTLFIWWTMRFLLAERVAWRVLGPSAVATGICSAGLAVFSKLYFSSSIISDDKTYGAIGAVFSITTWLIAIGAALLLGAVAGAAWRESRASLRAARLHEPD